MANMVDQTASKEEKVSRLAAAVRRNPIFWAALSGCTSLMVALAVVGFGGSWEAVAGHSTAVYLVLFLVVSLVEVVAMPLFFLFLAQKGLNAADQPAGEAAFANYYGLAMMGGITPCALGLVYYFISANLLLALLFYLIGLAHLLYYYLRLETIITRLLGRVPG